MGVVMSEPKKAAYIPLGCDQQGRYEDGAWVPDPNIDPSVVAPLEDDFAAARGILLSAIVGACVLAGVVYVAVRWWL